MFETAFYLALAGLKLDETLERVAAECIDADMMPETRAEIGRRPSLEIARKGDFALIEIDDVAGPENIYVLASYDRLIELEACIGDPAARDGPGAGARLAGSLQIR